MARKKTTINVETLRHNDERVNIPTSELRDFVGDAEMMPPTMRYPRNPDLDPQLVWKGKDEQDGQDLEVLAVPIYIQEKIHPQAIVEEVRRRADTGDSPLPQQIELFSDFNGIEFEDLIEFYQHSQHWTNRMILGDSLQVMTSLAEKEGMKGKVQMIYLDPPYGIKFGSNWQVSTRNRDVKDGRESDISPQPEQVKAFRDTWELGIHSYLSYLRDRLVLARELLTERGSVFVQIGDENVHLVRNLLDEVFGARNFIALITFSTTSSFDASELSTTANYLVWYGKDKKQGIKFNPLFEQSSRDPAETPYKWILLPDGEFRGLTKSEISGIEPISSDVKLYKPSDITSQGKASENQNFVYRNKSYDPGVNSHWKANYPVGMSRLAVSSRLHIARNSIQYVRFSDDFGWKSRTNIWTDTGTGSFTDDKVYVVQTNIKVIERCMLMTTDPGDLVLDPTMGSGTTAYVAEQWGRRWITCDTSRVALALARTRLMSARYPFYLLADSPEGAQKEMQVSGKLQAPHAYTHDIKAGFVYERVPHIMLKDIANNAEIDLIHERWQPALEEKRAWLNTALGQAWEEWQVPRELPNESDAIQQVLADYWRMRRERQAQMDESIARNSERETLYDRPYEDKNKIRVTGPFTVESLSPHRILDASYIKSATQVGLSNIGGYEQMVIENLRVAGVQNTLKGQRLKFNTLEPYGGIWLHAVGTYTDAQGEERQVAVSIGSEHGTVTARQIKEAAKEAVKGLGYDLLLVCGFAFEAATSEESKRYGNTDVQIVRMNNDLMIGDALKKTDKANLFTIFGEPDLTIDRQPDGRVVVRLLGLDIYDPTRAELRASSTDDIACWFIDTDYNEESFFVRHAYFLGKSNAYDNLKRVLKGEVDESAWEMLYSDVSMPFDLPSSGKIAVKVINHYGDEVLKVYAIN